MNRFVWPIYSAFYRCWDIEQLHNSGAQIPYLENKSKQNDFRREAYRSPANIPLEIHVVLPQYFREKNINSHKID